MTLNAFGITVTTFSGQNFGAGLYDRMRKSVRSGMIMAVAASLGITVLFLLFGNWGIRLFVNDESTLAFGMRLLYVMVPGYVTYVPIEILSGACRSAGDSLKPMLITAIGICGLRVIWLLAVVPFWHELEVLAFSYPLTWVITSIFFIIYYLKGNWLKRNLPTVQPEPEP